MRFSTAEIARLTDGRLVGPDVGVDGATQDSRAVGAGQLFVPLVAERDGHDFIGSALDAGAGGYLTEREPIGGSAVVVSDTMVALRRLGMAARERLTGPVVGITGSVGKTSTKDLVVAALGEAFRAHASVRSFNNEIGVPLTLLNAPEDAQVTVVEMGARGLGHVAELCEVARPTVGVVTTVAAAHTEEFGDVETIAVAKGELIEALPADGLAVLNGDVELVSAMRARTDADVLLFGRGEQNDVRIVDVRIDDELRTEVALDSPWGRFEITPPTRGGHLAPNVAAASTVALWLGVTPEQVVAGLEGAALSPWRMEVLVAPTGATIINDSYNANPTSMRGALDSLAALRQPRKVAVLGYMAELGATEASEHRSIADYARKVGAELIAVGTSLYGVEPASDAVAMIGELDDSVAVLVKGSRAAGLEVVADALMS